MATTAHSILPNVRQHTILLTVFGSRAYGTHTPQSDVDLRGVAIPPAAYFHGFAHEFEQVDQPAALAPFRQDLTPEEQRIVDREGKVDGSVYDIRKFMRLAAGGNPSILEALFCREEEVRICTPAGKLLRDNRHAFLSRKILHTFCGYAQQQMRRMQNHRRWLIEPPKQPPSRAEFGLAAVPEVPTHQRDAALAEILKHGFDPDLSMLDPAQRIYVMGLFGERLAQLQITSDVEFAATGRSLGYHENFLQLLDKERHYKMAIADWQAYLIWQKERNPERAALERRVGYDAKHASHLVRLLGAAKEILATGNYSVFRPNIDELREVRAGAWAYEQILAWADAAEREVKEIAVQSPLPPTPDLAFLDALCCQLVGAATTSDPKQHKGRKNKPIDPKLMPLPLQKYEPPADRPRAILVDIDGTVALAQGRSPYDEGRVHEDLPNLPVIAVATALVAQGNALVFMSGRTAGCREATLLWLRQYFTCEFALFMRPVGDTRKDSLVKVELFDAHVRLQFQVTCVLDDRNQVVDMWRALGLTCLQVAPGDF